MKKLILVIISIIIISPLMAQQTTDTVSQVQSKRGIIYGLNFLTSIMNDNQRLSALTSIPNINQVNMGFDFIFGYSTNKGFEYTMDIGLETWTNIRNNKQIATTSGLYSFNLGYKIEFCEKAKLSIVPRLGIGWNFNSLNYSEVTNRDISFSELSKYTWNVDQYTNFYVPAALEIHYKTSKTTSMVIGAEYRYFFYTGSVDVFQTNQQIYDFPKFTANQLSFKIGYTKLFKL